MSEGSTRRPNILLLLTDQQRGDCLGVAGHPVLQTPHLDSLALEGCRFDRAYSACPVCVPARRTLMTGRTPANQRALCNVNAGLDGPTLPEVLGRHGYQTHLVGKLHFHPPRKRYGFDSMDWADGPNYRAGAGRADDDYQRFLRRIGIDELGHSGAHGISANAYPARPWPGPERSHFTNWCAEMAIDFLERRDPTAPFFLKVSFLHPHQPCTPPQLYYDRYLGMDLPEPVVGDWARVFDDPPAGHPVEPWRVRLPEAQQRQFQAAYYGSINHIDDQIGRILQLVPPDTWVLFCSDHGEMLGDHQWFRKRTPWEGSVHVPFILRPPKGGHDPRGLVRSQPVELMDVMPTLLDAAGIDVPDTVDGSSVLPLLTANDVPWRERLHGECSEIPTLDSGMQYLTDGRRKYIWFPGLGNEQFFDLESDPRETVNRIDDPDWSEAVDAFRADLIDRLRDRPEGFVDGDRLARLTGPTPHLLS
ncbi:MAG: arylsulfatase [Opitutales bacterium]